MNMCLKFLKNVIRKTVINRTLAQWTKIKNKEFYYIMTAADDSKNTMACTLECFRGFASRGLEMMAMWSSGLCAIEVLK